jgi:hypothetical protein
VPRNAARVLRYMDRYLLLKQGEVFYMTEALARLEGLERGPAGNVSLAAAFALAQEMNEDQTIVVQETEYAGAGKQPSAQLTFARTRGVEVLRGDPETEVPGRNVVIPDHPSRIRVRDVAMNRLRGSLIRKAAAGKDTLSEADLKFLAEETMTDRTFVMASLAGSA